MADEPDLQIYGALSAFGFALENLYALVLQRAGASLEDVKATREEMLRQFEDLPWRNEVEPGDTAYAVRQHGVHRLERLWKGIEERLGG